MIGIIGGGIFLFFFVLAALGAGNLSGVPQECKAKNGILIVTLWRSTCVKADAIIELDSKK